MNKNHKFIGVILLLLLGLCACANQTTDTTKSISKEQESFPVSAETCFKAGTEPDGNIVLEGYDFNGFDYKFDQQNQEYIFTFHLNEDGQEKLTEATTKMAEISEQLSLWIGDEFIVSAVIAEPIQGDSFSLNMTDLSKDHLSDFTEKLEGTK